MNLTREKQINDFTEKCIITKCQVVTLVLNGLTKLGILLLVVVR